MALDLKKLLDGNGKGEEVVRTAAPLAGTLSQSQHRLQVGLAGLATILLMLVVVDVVVDRTAQTEADVVSTDPDVIAAEDAVPAQTDPLADAGVVPDLPVEAAPEESTQPAPGPTAAAGPDVAPDDAN